MSLRKYLMSVSPIQCHLNIVSTVPHLKQVNVDLIALGEGSGTVPKRQNFFFFSFAVGLRLRIS